MLFCVIPAIARYVEYVKIRVVNFHIMMEICAKAMLCKFLNKVFAIVKDNGLLTTYLRQC